MTARGKARKRAVDVLFEADLRAADIGTTLQAAVDRADPPVHEHAVRLVRLVEERRPAIDAAIADRLVDWPLDRVAPVDRAILRLGVAELLWVDDVPDAVAIDEAIELAKALSGDEAPAFVNGVLGRVEADRAQLLAGGSGGVGEPSGVGVEDTPVDQPLGELAGTLVVDDGE